MEVPAKSEFDALQTLVMELSKKVEVLEARERNRPSTPKEWLMQSEANKLFIGKGGKTLERHAFYRMVDTWLAQGDLVRGVSYMQSGSVKFISRDFLAGKIEVKNKNIRKAA